MEYPAPFILRNTFIDSIEKPFCLEGFLMERKLQSCPTSRVEETCKESPLDSYAGAFASLRCLQKGDVSVGSRSTSMDRSTRASNAEDSCSDDGLKSWRSGALDHQRGTCNPCAHFHSSKGCRNGSQCRYCHECPPGELKRRQKARRRALQQATSAA